MNEATSIGAGGSGPVSAERASDTSPAARAVLLEVTVRAIAYEPDLVVREGDELKRFALRTNRGSSEATYRYLVPDALDGPEPAEGIENALAGWWEGCGARIVDFWASFRIGRPTVIEREP